MVDLNKQGSTTATLERLKKSGQLAALTRARPGAVTDGVQEIPLDRIVPDPEQPRRIFDSEMLASLAESIKAQGVLQPITVQPNDGLGKHVIIMGERRYRAAQLAGLSMIPALIKEATPALRMAQLTENVQRADLTTLEIAQAVDVMRKAGQSRSEIAAALGWNEGEVSRFAAVTRMPSEFQHLALANVPIRSLSDLHALWKRDSDTVRRFLADTEPQAVNRPSVEALRARIETPSLEAASPFVSSLTPPSAPRLDAREPSTQSLVGRPETVTMRPDEPPAPQAPERRGKGIALICRVGDDVGRIDMRRMPERAGHLVIRFDGGERIEEIALEFVCLVDVVPLD